MAYISLRQLSSPALLARLGKGCIGKLREKTFTFKATDNLRKNIRDCAMEIMRIALDSLLTSVRLLNQLKRGSDNNCEERQST
jgi:hypothetical protein